MSKYTETIGQRKDIHLKGFGYSEKTDDRLDIELVISAYLPITIDGEQVKSITIDGVEVKGVTIDGTTVF